VFTPKITRQKSNFMQASIEISMYPLEENYREIIKNFIERLNLYPKIRVKTNVMSTQVFGDFDTLMDILAKEVKTTFLAHPSVVVVCKLINKDLDN